MAKNKPFSDPETHLKNIQRYLEQGFFLEDQIASDRSKLKRLSSLSYSLSSPGDLSGAKVQTSPANEAAFTESVEQKDEVEEKLRREISLMIALQTQMADVINQYTTGAENRILTERYINCQTEKKVAELTHYCLRQIKRKTDIAMSRIILPEDAIWINWNALQQQVPDHALS